MAWQPLKLVSGVLAGPKTPATAPAAVADVKTARVTYVGNGASGGQLVALPFAPHEVLVWYIVGNPSARPPQYNYVLGKKYPGMPFTAVDSSTQYQPDWDGPDAFFVRAYNGSYQDPLNRLPVRIDLQAGGVFVRGPLNTNGVQYSVTAMQFSSL